VNAFSSLPSVRRLLSTREHQDAHELFLLLASAISDELAKLSNERQRDLGFAGPLAVTAMDGLKGLVVTSSNSMYLPTSKKGKEKERIMSPWEGLSANRRSCLKCGWCEAIRYETMGALDVAVPMNVSDIAIDLSPAL
jgi:ubiquitin carboxyl-terminal hydrolase 1